MLFGKRLTLVISLTVLVGCAAMARQDMDNVVNVNGIPRSLSESFIGGKHPRHMIYLYYPDGVFLFQTNAQKSYSILVSSQTTSIPGPQSPIPVWFKAKYPALNWADVPTK